MSRRPGAAQAPDAPVKPPMALHTRLMLAVFAIVAAILIVVSVVTGVILNNVLTGQVDSRLREATSALTGQFGITMLDGTAGEQLERTRASPGMLLVIDSPFTGATGAVVGNDYDRYTLSDAQIEGLLSAIDGTEGLTTVTISGLGQFRVMGIPSQGGEPVAALGMSTAAEKLTLQQMFWSIGLATVGGMLLLGVATSGIIRRGLRPLRRVAATATRVSRQRLDQGDVRIAERVPAEEADPATEVGRVGAALNTLLDHVEDSLSARQRNEETMRRFVADASHELRTPLASIRGYSELSLRDGTLSEGSRQSLQRIEAQSQRMTGLVEDLLLLARLDEGHELVYDMVDLRQVVVDAVGDQAMAGMEHDWGAEVGEEPVLVAGDRARLTQVVTNLLANARTHTPEGTSVTVSLATTGEGSQTRAILTVDDTGPGIEPEIQATLFTRFARGDVSRARKTGGSGLGLSIVKAIVDAHHGEISVDSRPGATRFIVSLPAKPHAVRDSSPSHQNG
ncbi:cell wall metabolism sensor histidine kinase WalK [Microbacterium sp. ZXX196]|uniref:sensor histidine kinase n=1 Tax=Microbacterium sp. ZXX196 TaxID=2609291 RepID=UPI001E5F79E0|nr:HAMP domain-containing sensor histidine kinase [Microbacterium sp. ZXX196]